ncbi:MAG: copper-binding protein [Deltaproteobacteria bacterium]|jgi:hypothetical protein|nr:copper-binding protein [Deltaproteobacteria bacterium]
MRPARVFFRLILFLSLNLLFLATLEATLGSNYTLAQGGAPIDQPTPQARGPQSPQVKASIITVIGQALAVNHLGSRLIIKCAPLKAVGWDKTILDFPVANPNQLKKIKKGDRVKLDVRFQGQKYVVVDIEKK